MTLNAPTATAPISAGPAPHPESGLSPRRGAGGPQRGGEIDRRDDHQALLRPPDGAGLAFAPELGGQGADDGVELVLGRLRVPQAGDPGFQRRAEQWAPGGGLLARGGPAQELRCCERVDLERGRDLAPQGRRDPTAAPGRDFQEGRGQRSKEPSAEFIRFG